MAWLNNLVSAITGNKKDIEQIRKNMQAPKADTPVTDSDIEAYIEDIDTRAKKMVKDLKNMYIKYGVEFSGFKSLEAACMSLREGIKSGKDEVYNNLIKLESSITSEQKRHVALIKIAVTKNGKKVIDQINQDPVTKQTFASIFGSRDVAGQENVDGTYQKLWSEIHKLAEFIITKKNRVYH